MALGSPEHILEMQKKIPQVHAQGIIISTKKISTSGCLHSYESVLKTIPEESEVVFSYSVSAGMCTTDGLYDIVWGKPFQKNSFIRVNLTDRIPHHLISYEIKFVPPQVSPAIPIVITAVLFITLVFLFVTNTKKKKN